MILAAAVAAAAEPTSHLKSPAGERHQPMRPQDGAVFADAVLDASRGRRASTDGTVGEASGGAAEPGGPLLDTVAPQMLLAFAAVPSMAESRPQPDTRRAPEHLTIAASTSDGTSADRIGRAGIPMTVLADIPRTSLQGGPPGPSEDNSAGPLANQPMQPEIVAAFSPLRISSVASREIVPAIPPPTSEPKSPFLAEVTGVALERHIAAHAAASGASAARLSPVLSKNATSFPSAITSAAGVAPTERAELNPVHVLRSPELSDASVESTEAPFATVGGSRERLVAPSPTTGQAADGMVDSKPAPSAAFQISQALLELSSGRAAVAESVDRMNFSSRAMSGAEAADKDVVKSLVLSLRPDELGSVEVRITARDGAVRVRLTFEHEKSALLIRSTASELTERLAGAGLVPDELVVDLMRSAAPLPAANQPSAFPPASWDAGGAWGGHQPERRERKEKPRYLEPGTETGSGPVDAAPAPADRGMFV